MEIRMELPDDLPDILRRTPQELSYDLRLRAIAGLVERGLVSSGRAAEIAAVSRREFLDWCGRWHIQRRALAHVGETWTPDDPAT